MDPAEVFESAENEPAREGILPMVELPSEANVLLLTVTAATMPVVGRGEGQMEQLDEWERNDDKQR